MQKRNIFLNANGSDWSQLVSVGVDFGLAYFGAKSENKKDRELLERLAELDTQEAEKLKEILKNSLNDVAKTEVTIKFLDAQKIKKLEAETKHKRTLSLIILGVGVISIIVILYKLKNRNE